MASSSVQLQPPSRVYIPKATRGYGRSDLANDIEATAGSSRQMEAEPQMTLLRRQGRAGPSAESEESHRTSATSSNLKEGQHQEKPLQSSAWVWKLPLEWGMNLLAVIFLPPPKKTPSILYQKELDNIKPFKLQNHVDGLPRLAALQDSNENWRFFRVFGPETARLLLKKEIELDLLAKCIHKEDEKEEKVSTARPRLEATQINPVSNPNIIIEEEFERKLRDYHALLAEYANLRTLRSVRQEDHQSLHNYIIRNRPIRASEEAFFYQIDDFVYAQRGQGAVTNHGRKLEEMVESFAARRPTTRLRTWLHNFLKDKREQGKTEEYRNIHNFSPIRLTFVSKVVAASSAVAVILIPVGVLYLASTLSPVLRAVVVIVFVFVFLIAVSVIGDWGAHELFLLMAAYVAILVALLANLSQGVGSATPSK